MVKGYPDWGYIQKRPNYFFTTGQLVTAAAHSFTSLLVPVGMLYEVNYAMIYFWSGVTDLIQFTHYCNADGDSYVLHKILTPVINQTYSFPLPFYITERDGIGFRVKVTTAPLDYEIRILYNEQSMS